MTLVTAISGRRREDGGGGGRKSPHQLVTYGKKKGLTLSDMCPGLILWDEILREKKKIES